ncbi:MAG TPA: ABC transporter ATP-binding protein [Candidatus Angelobacter sp.]|nr:ABC transporter ATP-binding protein [Candidatus Angelobacter sp.]
MENHETVATLTGVTKKYGAVTALQDVSLNVRKGELLAVLGPNGAGKTTAIRLLLGLSTPAAGQVTVFGQNPRHVATRRRVGTMLQISKVPETLKVKEHIDLFSSYYPRPLSRKEVLSAAGLEGFENRLFGKLSGGERQRVLFALAICGDPELLFLDEPTVGLDVSTRYLIWQQVRRLIQQGRTVILTTHYLEEVDALADRVVVLNQGVVVAEGSPAEIKSRTALRKIRCSTRLPLDQIWTIPEVNDVLAQDTRIEILTSQVEPVLRELFSRDPNLSSLDISNSSLEEAFLQIIGSREHQPASEVTA